MEDLILRKRATKLEKCVLEKAKERSEGDEKKKCHVDQLICVHFRYSPI